MRHGTATNFELAVQIGMLHFGGLNSARKAFDTRMIEA